MANIGWGKPGIYVRPVGTEGNGGYKKVPDPVENSTQLSTTKGEKKEAKVEGGENEDVRYNKNNYALEYQIRIAKNKEMPYKASDGIVSGNHEVVVVPEDNEVPGIKFDNSTVSAEDTFTTEEGGAITYTHDALKPATGNQCKWGTSVVTKEAGEETYSIVFTELQ
jgi:hypothetical protein